MCSAQPERKLMAMPTSFSAEGFDMLGANLSEHKWLSTESADRLDQSAFLLKADKLKA